MKVLLLGTGTSHGVPSIGCACEVCVSGDPRNWRTRCSAAVFIGESVALIDTAPELRLQAIHHRLHRVDAVLYTHSHADHIFGLDDVRRFNEMQGADIPVYAEPFTLEDIQRAFRYIFVPTQVGGGKPKLALNSLDSEAFDLFGEPVRPLRVWHGAVPVTAFRFSRFAYVTDCSAIPDETMEALAGLDVLVLDALRWRPHPTHLNIEQALEIIARLKPGKTYLTHTTHDLDYEKTNASLPKDVELAYDGLLIEV
ncbi:MAG: MBL fold metallo-hydrolase [Armatimonadetes bacterium]|nr:MBL fold metallo-hydrolase [Armatimonadota bacterium]